MRKSSALLLAVLALLAAACSSDAREQIEGTWLESASGACVEYDDDGQFKTATNSDFEAPFEWGDYTFDGERFTMNTASDSPECSDASATWTVVFSADGDEASMTFIEDSCVGSPRSTDLVLIRQSS